MRMDTTARSMRDAPVTALNEWFYNNKGGTADAKAAFVPV